MEFLIVWLVLLVAGACAYVAFRSWAARRRGEDGYEAGKRAVWDVVPVVGAGLAGIGIFLAIGCVIVFLVVVFLIASIGGGDTGELGNAIALLILGGLAFLIGLPLAAVAVVVSIRRSRRARGE